MGSVNAINNRTDQTVQIFDRFYGYQQSVAADEYDVVFSYFKSVFGSTEAAGNFTVSLFRVSNQSKIPVLTLLQQLQGQSGPQLTASLTYFLNGVRSATTLLGVKVPTQPNYYVAHNIRI
jgi:hypothetical protein